MDITVAADCSAPNLARNLFLVLGDTYVAPSVWTLDGDELDEMSSRCRVVGRG